MGVTLRDKLEVIDDLAVKVLTMGFMWVVKKDRTERLITTHLNTGTTILVVQIDAGHKFLISVAERVGERAFSVEVDYNKYLSKLKLPINSDHLRGETTKNIDNYLVYEVGAANYQTMAMDESDTNGDNAKWIKFFRDIINPAFEKFQKTGINELSEKDKDAFIRASTQGVGAFDKPGPASSSKESKKVEVKPKAPSPAPSVASAFVPAARAQESKPLPEELPKFDDEYEMQRRDESRGIPESPFAPIGDRDLHPFGKYPPLRPDIGGLEGGVVGPTSGGMIPDANHPLFQGGRSGSRGGLNRGDHPPGSRYDDPLGRDDFDAIGKGLPGGRGLGGGNGSGGPFGGGPFGRSDGFGGSFGDGFI